MVEDGIFTSNDIPICPTTEKSSEKILWDEAKGIYKRNMRNGNSDFYCDAFICWYMDDYKFDSSNGIWKRPYDALKIIQHFAGIITPDFSTYQDFPEPIKSFNTYRMRAFGFWLGKHRIAVINNVRWGTEESYRYAFDGIEKESIVAIGTCGGSPRKIKDRDRFEKGLEYMVQTLQPKTIILYGSSNYRCFKKLQNEGIEIVSYKSKMNQAFQKRKANILATCQQGS